MNCKPAHDAGVFCLAVMVNKRCDCFYRIEQTSDEKRTNAIRKARVGQHRKRLNDENCRLICIVEILNHQNY